MRAFKIALVSLLVTPDIRANFLRIVDAVEYAHSKGCDLICFPECSLTGLVMTNDYEYDFALAEKIPGKMTDDLGKLARKYNIYIAIGLLERDGEMLYDSAVLFANSGEIILKYRRINPRWHSSKSPIFYSEGKELYAVCTPFGKLAFAICGDMFDENVVAMIRSEKPDYLIVPLSRSYGDFSVEWWNNEEKHVYAQQVADIGIKSFLINSFESGFRWPSFGGIMIVSGDGKIISETKPGAPSVLEFDFIGDNND